MRCIPEKIEIIEFDKNFYEDEEYCMGCYDEIRALDDVLKVVDENGSEEFCCLSCFPYLLKSTESFLEKLNTIKINLDKRRVVSIEGVKIENISIK